MTVPHTYNSFGPEGTTWLYVFIFVLVLAAMGGKRAIAWLLMKLYELFIQQNPVEL
jgi:hypothetical protein